MHVPKIRPCRGCGAFGDFDRYCQRCSEELKSLPWDGAYDEGTYVLVTVALVVATAATAVAFCDRCSALWLAFIS